MREQQFTTNKDATTEIPKGAIPFEEALLSTSMENENNIVSMRLEAEEFKRRIWLVLAGYRIKKINKRSYLVPSEHFKGTITPQAANKLCGRIEQFINSPTALGHTRYEEAQDIWSQLYDSLIGMLVLDKDFKDLTWDVWDEIAAFQGKHLPWHQLTRAIDGRESKNLITRIEEARSDQTIKESFSTGGRGMGLSNRSARGGEQS